MSRTQTWLKNGSFLIVVAFLAGCNSETEYPVVPAGGEVLVDGKPVAGALVVFVPDPPPADPKAPWPRAKTGANGQFKLTTYKLDDGAPPGDYRVTVTLDRPLSAARFKRDEAEDSPDDGETKNVLPERYSDPETSGLKATIAADGTLSLPTITLKSK